MARCVSCALYAFVALWVSLGLSVDLAGAIGGPQVPPPCNEEDALGRAIGGRMTALYGTLGFLFNPGSPLHGCGNGPTEVSVKDACYSEMDTQSSPVCVLSDVFELRFSWSEVNSSLLSDTNLYSSFCELDQAHPDAHDHVFMQLCFRNDGGCAHVGPSSLKAFLFAWKASLCDEGGDPIVGIEFGGDPPSIPSFSVFTASGGIDTVSRELVN